MNTKSSRKIETYFLMTAHRYRYVSFQDKKGHRICGRFPAGSGPGVRIEKSGRKLSDSEAAMDQEIRAGVGPRTKYYPREPLNLKNPSVILAISAKEKEFKSQGVDVIGFGAGESEFPTSFRIREAAEKIQKRPDLLHAGSRNLGTTKGRGPEVPGRLRILATSWKILSFPVARNIA